MRLLLWVGAAAVGLLAAACGGAGDAPGAPAQPTIVSFSANQPDFRMGERARLTAVFSGGTGRIEPGVGPVQSGVPVDTPALEGDVTLRLVVEAPGQPAAARVLALPVHHRDRLVPAGSFHSAYHSAVELPDGSVLIVGGWRGGRVHSAAIDRFDPGSGTFTPVGAMATGRAWPRPVVLDDGKVLIAGGETNAASGITFELFDPAAGTVVPAGVPVRNRVGHTATRLPDGRVLIAGGLEDDTAELWDPVTRTARPVDARLSNPREWHTATLLADGRVLLVGGYTMSNRYWLAELFDPRTEQFTPIGAPRTPGVDALALHFAHRMTDGSVLVAGGEGFTPGEAAVRPTAVVQRFDPATLQFTPLAGLLIPRTLMAGVALADDRVLLFGGIAADESFLASGEMYRAGRSPAPAASLVAGRAWHTVSRLPGGRVLIVGGLTPGGDIASDAWIYE
jgi:hypothetical protein